MFSEFVEARSGESGRKSWAIVVSTLFEAVALVALLLVPLFHTEALPPVLALFRGTIAGAIPLVPTPKPPRAPAHTSKPGKRFFENGILHAPPRFPHSAVIFQELELPPEVPPDASSSGYGVTDLFNYLAMNRSEAGPPPVVPTPIQRIRQSEIQQAMILSQPQPVYPALARNVRIQGEVVLHAIIDREGRVADLRVVSGHPLLVEAALSAVRNWRYRPTLVSGEPVEVETTIKVSFVLGGSP